MDSSANKGGWEKSIGLLGRGCGGVRQYGRCEETMRGMRGYEESSESGLEKKEACPNGHWVGNWRGCRWNADENVRLVMNWMGGCECVRVERDERRLAHTSVMRPATAPERCASSFAMRRCGPVSGQNNEGNGW